MRRFIVTSPKFAGQAELVYNEHQVLCMIDCTKTDMGEETITAFKRSVPALLEVLSSGKCFSPETTVVESNFIVSFTRFWTEYPLHRNRYRAEKLFEKLSGSQQVQAYYSLTHYKRYLQRTGIFAMGADKYLADRHYQTEWNKL